MIYRKYINDLTIDIVEYATNDYSPYEYASICNGGIVFSIEDESRIIPSKTNIFSDPYWFCFLEDHLVSYGKKYKVTQDIKRIIVPYTVHITSKPIGADVFINDEKAGKTPFNYVFYGYSNRASSRSYYIEAYRFNFNGKMEKKIHLITIGCYDIYIEHANIPENICITF